MKKLILWLETVAVVVSFVLILSALVWERFGNPSERLVMIFYALAFVIGGYSKAFEGVQRTIEDKHLNVEFLMIFAALAAYITGNYSEGAILILIFSISGVMESYATAKSEKALTSLLELAPETALLMEEGEPQEVNVKTLVVGDIVMVKVGQMVPVDGTIMEGTTDLNESTITGEFNPVSKGVGQSVYAGSINETAMILVRSDQSPEETVIQKIVDFVKKAQNDFPQSQTRVELFEKYYVYVVVLLAILVGTLPALAGWWLWEEAIYRGIIVLVVGSPCALVASISPAILATLSNASRKRILIKGGSRLEGLKDIKVVMFDKTGTVTTGKPYVVEMMWFTDDYQDERLSIVKSLEKQSTHPLAKAVLQHTTSQPTLEGLESEEIPGHGMQAQIEDNLWQVGRFDHPLTKPQIQQAHTYAQSGYSLVWVYVNKKAIGMAALNDTIRPQVEATVQHLKDLGLHVVLLTGDVTVTAHAIAASVSIVDVIAECLPEDKAYFVQKYQREKGPVLMIGDGINDAPALALADVSIAMGTGTDVSLETSDIVLMNDDLKQLPSIFHLAKRMRIIISMNVIFSVSVIALLMVGNLLGLVLLPLGVLAHELSTITVILNSLRLLVR